MYFGADEKTGVVNGQFFLVLRGGGNNSLYHYRDQELTDYIGKFPALADSMKDYAYSMIQTAQWLIANKKTGPLDTPTRRR